MTLAIYLRDITRDQSKFLVEVQHETDDDYIEDAQMKKIFKEFIERAETQLPIKSKKVDVWVGVWLNESQFTLEFPIEFLNLVSKNNWKVTFDLND